MLAAFYSIPRAEGGCNMRGGGHTEVRKHREGGGGTWQKETHTQVHSYRDTIGPIWGCCQQGHGGERKQDDFSSASFHHTALTPLFTSPIYLHIGCLPPCLAVCVYRPCMCVYVCVCDYQHINSDGVRWAGHYRLWSTAWEHAVWLVSVKQKPHVLFRRWKHQQSSPVERLRRKVNSRAGSQVFQAISTTDSPLTQFQFYFPVISSGSQAFLSPRRHLIASLHTPYVPLRVWASRFHLGGGQKCSIQFPNLILVLGEMLLSVCLAHVHMHTAKNGPYHAVPPVPQGCGHAFSLHIAFFLVCLFVLPGLLWSMTRERQRARAGSK